MASPTVPILPVGRIKRAKKTKWCAACNRRIPAGTPYVEHNPWRWTHLGECLGAPR